jgi:cysteine sulfinate desulfinase/cysteine desulfurase-like protein
MGLDPLVARSSVRFSLGYASAPADIDAALAVVPRAVAGLRSATTV